MKCLSENRSDDGIIQMSPKNGEKMQVFRIFCELIAKMGPGSRINRGVSEGYCRNEESPKQGIDTPLLLLPPLLLRLVEMKKARSRALTH
ncbi:hypothetical protein [Schaedlerella arabinosiphila]|uniref:hypothetical protein n=1 Tax=Schaedlerella arabinosiphila TaxID=2044587 RepID=UPI003FA7C3B1